jgi:hypothetical protein
MALPELVREQPLVEPILAGSRDRAPSPGPGTRVPTADGARVPGWRAWHASDF